MHNASPSLKQERTYDIQLSRLINSLLLPQEERLISFLAYSYRIQPPPSYLTATYSAPL